MIGGLHHVAIEAADFEQSLRFYTEGLGFVERLRFPEPGHTVALLDAGNGSFVELFSPSEDGPRAGGGPMPDGHALFHVALHVEDCDAATQRALAAGAELVEGPADMTLEGQREGQREVPCRYSFVRGPGGESIEFITIEAL